MATRTLPDNDQGVYDDKFDDMMQHYPEGAEHPTEPPLRDQEEEAADAAPAKNGSPELGEAERSPAGGGAGLYKPEGDNPGNKIRAALGNKKLPRGKRRGVAIIIAVVMTTTGGTLAFLEGPNLVINHLSRLLLGKMSEMQADQSWRYRRRFSHRLGDMFTIKGRIGSKLISEMRRYGYQFQFDNDGKIKSVRTPRGAVLQSAEEIAGGFNDYLDTAHPLKSVFYPRWRGRIGKALLARYHVSLRSEVARAPNEKEADAKKSTNKAMLEAIEGQEGELANITATGETPKTGDQSTDASNASKDQTLKDIAQGEDSSPDNPYNQIKNDIVKNGTNVVDMDKDTQALLSHTATQAKIDLAEKLMRGSAGKIVFASVKSFLVPTDALDKVCTAKGRMSAVVLAARVIRAAALIRYASVFIKLADKTRTPTITPGDIDPQMVGDVMSRVTSPDDTGRYVGQSTGFDYMLNGKFSKSTNDADKDGIGVDGTLTGILGAIALGLRHVPGTGSTGCGIVQNVGFQIGSSVAMLAVGIFIPGGGEAADGAVVAAEQSVADTIKTSIKNILTKQFAKQIAKDAAKSTAIELSFEGALSLAMLYAQQSMSLNFTGQEQGAMLGNILVGGAGTLNKQRSLAAGMVPATPSEYREAKAKLTAEKTQDMQHESVFARVFDYNNSDSLAFQTMTKIVTTPALTNPTAMASAISAGLGHVAYALSNPTSLFSAISKTFFGKAFAASSDPDIIDVDTYDANGTNLATDPAGNLIPIMRDDIANIDPINNANALIASGDIDSTTLQPKSDRFKQHVDNCVNSVDTLSVIEDEDQSKPEYDCLARLPITKQFKAHLAYLDMVDGLETSVGALD